MQRQVLSKHIRWKLPWGSFQNIRTKQLLHASLQAGHRKLQEWRQHPGWCGQLLTPDTCGQWGYSPDKTGTLLNSHSTRIDSQGVLVCSFWGSTTFHSPFHRSRQKYPKMGAVQCHRNQLLESKEKVQWAMSVYVPLLLASTG